MAKKETKQQTSSEVAASTNLFRARLSEDRIELAGGGHITLRAVDSQAHAYCADMAMDQRGLRLPSLMQLYVLSFSIVDWAGIHDEDGKEVKPEFADLWIGGDKYRQLSLAQLKTMDLTALEYLKARVVELNYLSAPEKKSSGSSSGSPTTTPTAGRKKSTGSKRRGTLPRSAPLV